MAGRMNDRKPSVFYGPPTNQVTEVRAGYLIKSPPCSKLNRKSSWRRRFFVLFKSSELDYQLKYFNSAEDRDKPLGEIDLKQITVMYVNPQHHPRWKWVQKNTRSAPSTVLYLRALDREFFLVGNNSSDVNDWYNALRNPRLASLEDNLYEVVDFNRETEPEKHRSTSEPPLPMPEVAKASDQRPTSEPVIYYNYPKAYQPLKERKEDWDGDADHHTDDGVVSAVNETNGSPNRKDTTAGEESDISPTDSCDCSGKEKKICEMIERLQRQNSTNSPEEQDINVHRADLKKHLTLTEEDGRLGVSAWTGQPPGLFQVGDRVVALNDLFICTTAEFHVYLSRILKNQVKLTVLRQQKGTRHHRHSL